MDIRRLTPQDAPAFRALRLRALREYPRAFTSSDAEDEQLPLQASATRLGSDPNRFWGAYEQGELCGMVGLERETRAKNRHKGHVVGMFVAPEDIGRGIGTALMQALIDDARACGLELLVLTVTEGDGSALRLYQRAGFRSFGIEPRAIQVDGHYHGKNHMVLELGPSS
ncbi:MAG TPA: GNAT family N-acetyltransferase [Ramlibacter sp.]|nr:GNAT family N-acetyltransferase [Ramlibacter sp.]